MHVFVFFFNYATLGFLVVFKKRFDYIDLLKSSLSITYTPSVNIRLDILYKTAHNIENR